MQRCLSLHLPATWEVRSGAYADVTGDGSPECVLSVWRPWQDWPIARWTARPTPIIRNRDAQGASSHIAVLKLLQDGAFRSVWMGSALFQPVTALKILPDGTLATLETTYRRGRYGAGVAQSYWKWTGFGFGLLRRELVQPDTLRRTPSELGKRRTKEP
ncbi:hypothetical protein [Deinococcus sp. Arct2-2]|uniref:hypothetical protein n=1 Tax=Deinococcus sp. Arct2-2 TaxID=2568653 RepID=UPI00197AD94E|nr:hypothetical protein [Deinococcus sp. Arct2-2]